MDEEQLDFTCDRQQNSVMSCNSLVMILCKKSVKITGIISGNREFDIGSG